MLHVWSTGIYGACTLPWGATVVCRNFIQTETFDPIWTVHTGLNYFDFFCPYLKITYMFLVLSQGLMAFMCIAI